MSCNCNTASKNCDPCSFCTPPGVTGLPQCIPVDPCSEKIDSCCVLFSGDDIACLEIVKDDQVCDIITKLFLAFSPNCTTTTSTTTTSTTTTSSTTTTTTTEAPCVCETFILQNDSGVTKYITYFDCNKVEHVDVPILHTQILTFCVCNGRIIYPEKGIIVYPGGPGCISTTTSTTSTTTSTTTIAPTTTTTTTINPCLGCYSFFILNLSGGNVSGYYYDCSNGDIRTAISLNQLGNITICACRSKIYLPNVSGLTIANLGTVCGPTTTTTTAFPIIPTTTTSTTTTSTTTSTTTTTSTSTTTTTASPTTTTTTLFPLGCTYWINNDFEITAFYNWVDCDGGIHTNEAIAPTIDICAEVGSVVYVSGATLTMGGPCPL